MGCLETGKHVGVVGGVVGRIQEGVVTAATPPEEGLAPLSSPNCTTIPTWHAARSLP